VDPEFARLVSKPQRIRKDISLTPEQIDTLISKSISPIDFYKWKYYLTLQSKRLLHRRIIKNYAHK